MSRLEIGVKMSVRDAPAAVVPSRRRHAVPMSEGRRRDARGSAWSRPAAPGPAHPTPALASRLGAQAARPACLSWSRHFPVTPPSPWCLAEERGAPS